MKTPKNTSAMLNGIKSNSVFAIATTQVSGSFNIKYIFLIVSWGRTALYNEKYLNFKTQSYLSFKPEPF